MKGGITERRGMYGGIDTDGRRQRSAGGLLLCILFGAMGYIRHFKPGCFVILFCFTIHPSIHLVPIGVLLLLVPR